MLFAAAAFAGLGMVASVNAAGHQRHAALHEKKHADKWSSAAPSAANATACGCKTYTTTWYGEPGLVPGPSTTSTSTSTSTSTPVWTSTSTTSTSVWVAPTTSSTSETPSSTWTPPASTSETPSSTWSPPASTSSPPAETYAPSSSSWAPAPSSSSSSEGGYLGDFIPSISISVPSSSPTGGSDAPISVDGDKWAMTYTPYADDGSCKDASSVASDIAAIYAKGFTTVRLYATDCNGIQNIGAACKTNNMKMIMGIYIDASGLGNGYSQVSELTSWGQSNGWDNVEMVVAGNEAIFNGYVTASELAGFITSAKSSFQSAGFTGPVTTTEPLNIIQENSAVICDAVDVIAANIHPFFNDAISASGAGAFVSSQLSLLSDCCGGAKVAYNLETGWPSAGDANGAAIPGTVNQQIAVDSIVAAAGSKSAIFSFENDGWKAPGSLGVEQFWGCASLFPDVY